MKSGTTAAAKATTNSPAERRKRQAGTTNVTTPETCQETQYTYNVSSPSNYSVWSCPNGTAFMTFGGGFVVFIALEVKYLKIFLGSRLFVFACWQEKHLAEGSIFFPADTRQAIYVHMHLATLRTKSFPTSDGNWKDEIATIFYKCVSCYFRKVARLVAQFECIHLSAVS